MNKTPKILVDFNAMIDCDLVLLSKTDSIKDNKGKSILLKEGMKICVYQDDENDDGEEDELIAYGTVELNHSGVRTTCKWNVRIDENGIRHQSDRNKEQNNQE